MNVIGMLKPKYSTTYLHDTDSLRAGLHILRESGYSAVPVVDEDGMYVGTVREGDFLWNVLDLGSQCLDTLQVKDVIRTDWNPAATDGEGVSSLVERALSQNFVPMVDDRNCYIGIITRRDVIQNILNKRIDSRYIVLPQEVEAAGAEI